MLKIYTDKKLHYYAAGAAAFLALHPGEANVVYVDLDPDVTIGGEGAFYSLNIDGNGGDDMAFTVYSATGYITYYSLPVSFTVKLAGLAPLGDNELLGNMTSSFGYTFVYAHKLEVGEGINSEDSFTGGYATLALNISVFGFPYAQQGAWAGAEMGYLGFRIADGENWHYGWMRLSVAEDASSLTIHDYAYDDAPDQAIFTGQEATEIFENPLTKTTVYSFGNTVFVALPEAFSGEAGLNIFDLAGHLVYSDKNIGQTMSVALDQIASGNYFVEISDNSFTYRKQVHLDN
ncbi:MAG: T9SS type A sorting domain-containing protein [Chitinophagales bacterium]